MNTLKSTGHIETVPIQAERSWKSDFRGFLTVQYLRGLSCLMVLGFHLNQQLHVLGREGSWFNGLAVCVDIFFVISGFIMWVSTSAHPNPPTFVARRIIRVVPLYWLVTGLIVSVMLVAPTMLQSARFDAGHVLSSFFFYPYPNPATGVMEPVLVPGWTLNYEMFFYAVFSLALFISTTHRTLIASSILIACVILGLVLRPAHDTALGFFTSDLILEFVMGMIIAAVLAERPKLSTGYARLGWAMIALATAVNLVLPEVIWPFASRFLGFGIVASMVVCGAVLIEKSRPILYVGPARRLGDISFSLYLTHVIVLSALTQVWKKLGWAGWTPGFALYGIVALALCLFVGNVTYNWVEQPMDRTLRDRLLGRARARRSSPAPA